jgi:N-formylglutamate amidohydrolase
MYPPEVVHAARIELAREALVSDNEAKAELEADEALQRELAHGSLDSESSGPKRRTDTP